MVGFPWLVSFFAPAAWLLQPRDTVDCCVCVGSPGSMATSWTAKSTAWHLYLERCANLRVRVRLSFTFLLFFWVAFLHLNPQILHLRPKLGDTLDGAHVKAKCRRGAQILGTPCSAACPPRAAHSQRPVRSYVLKGTPSVDSALHHVSAIV